MLLRYPGGKSRGALTQRILDAITARYTGGVFGELFFGGGGISFHLLKKRQIESLVINDLDPAIAKLWRKVITHPRYLKSSVRRFRPSVDAFVKAKSRVLGSKSSALDTLVVNRLSHGGRGVMGGPQGGYKQSGTYKISCRWNPDQLCNEIQTAHDLLTSVPVKCYQRSYAEVPFDFAYLDPPYFEKGDGLYHCSFTNLDHIKLAGFVSRETHWVLSYNNHPFIRDLYRRHRQSTHSTAGNGGAKLNSELIITPR